MYFGPDYFYMPNKLYLAHVNVNLLQRALPGAFKYYKYRANEANTVLFQ